MYLSQMFLITLTFSTLNTRIHTPVTHTHSHTLSLMHHDVSSFPLIDGREKRPGDWSNGSGFAPVAPHVFDSCTAEGARTHTELNAEVIKFPASLIL